MLLVLSTGRSLSSKRPLARLPVSMGRQRTAGEIIQCLARRVDLIVMASVREGSQFVSPGREPGCLLRHVHLTGLKARGLRQDARLLVKARFLKDDAILA